MSNLNQETTTIRDLAHLETHYLRAIELKASGKTHAHISAALKQQFGADLRAELNTVNQWFTESGLLRNALDEYNEKLANESVKNAKVRMKKLQDEAVEVMGELMRNGDDSIRLGAAKEIVARHIPAKQVNIEAKDDGEVPADLVPDGDDVIDNDQPSVNDAQVSGEVNQDNGTGPGEEVPSVILPEPSAPDASGNPPA